MEDEAPVTVKPVSRWEVPVEDSTEGDGWLLVYLDVMTLLVVMFVVMLAFAGEGQGDSQMQVAETETKTTDRAEEPSPRQEQWAEGALGEDIQVIVEGESVRFRISSSILFESGQAQLSKPGKKALDQLVPVLQNSDHEVRVAGHTDNLPIRTERFPSNWELSSARAGQVVRYLESQGIPPEQMVALGYAHTEPRSSNASPQGRAENRRVELVLTRNEKDGSGQPDKQ